MNRKEPQIGAERFAVERRELEAVLESGLFAACSNAVRLLRFVCESYFENPAIALTEYDVAVRALGRRHDFDARRDSIVRVEAHRVRKRLQEYYESEGASSPLQIVLPRGQYVPQFVAAAPGKLNQAEKQKEPGRGLPAVARRPVRRRYAWAAGIIVLVGLVAWSAKSSLFSQGRPTPKPAVPAGAAAANPVRILAGLESGELIDRTGTRWQPDSYFTGGKTVEVRYHSLALADDPAVYQHARIGEEFGYDIPLPQGVYEMRLMFAESSERVIVGSLGNGSRSFTVTANGSQILPPPDKRHLKGLDIIADAGGPDTADVKVLKDITPASDGKLHLRFVGRNQMALLNAIEIVPGLKGKMWPLRWRANETSYIDRGGNLWLPDRYFSGGRLSRFHAVVSQTRDPSLYEAERFGSFTYQIPVVADATYRVTLHFAENYFGGWVPQGSSPRLFSVYANHTLLLRDFNVFQEAGGATRALTRTFNGIRPSPFDKIVLSFEPSTEFAIVNAIEVEDETE